MHPSITPKGCRFAQIRSRNPFGGGTNTYEGRLPIQHKTRAHPRSSYLLSNVRSMLFKRSKTEKHIDEICSIVQTVIADDGQRNQLLKAEREDAQIWLDSLQVAGESPKIASHDRSSIFKITLKLSKRSGLCPEFLMIKNVKKIGESPIGGGGFGDVWKGKIEEQTVCLKVIRSFQTSNLQELHKDFSREGILWKQLEFHPNILPFLGMYFLNNAPNQLCLVSPWMERGALTKFLESSFGRTIDRHTLAYDVASGLAYLHSKKFVHGDLKGLNIFIRAEDERACIGDFGLARVSDSQAISLTSTSYGSKGTLRYFAPELLNEPPSPTQCKVTSMLMEIFTGKLPFYENLRDGVLMRMILDGKHPTRPTHTHITSDKIWELMVDCWNSEPRSRPTAAQVLERIAELKRLETKEDIRPPPEWNKLTLEKNVKRKTPVDELAKKVTGLHDLLIALLKDEAETEELVSLKVHFQEDKFVVLQVSPSIVYEELASRICRQIQSVWEDDYDSSTIVIKRENEIFSGEFVTLTTDQDVRTAFRRGKDGLVSLFVSDSRPF
ncbi:kinase-like protein [Marasmius fiardii PR-910]|nr:kinase-like protein [Marasmius fiardii PR-910]